MKSSVPKRLKSILINLGKNMFSSQSGRMKTNIFCFKVSDNIFRFSNIKKCTFFPKMQ